MLEHLSTMLMVWRFAKVPTILFAKLKYSAFRAQSVVVLLELFVAHTLFLLIINLRLKSVVNYDRILSEKSVIVRIQ
jgi:hypothetical protein